MYPLITNAKIGLGSLQLNEGLGLRALLDPHKKTPLNWQIPAEMNFEGLISYNTCAPLQNNFLQHELHLPGLPMTRFIRIAFYFFCLSAFNSIAADYPSKTIKLVVPVAPGGPNDIFARTLAPKLSLSLGQSVVIENIAGAGGNQATAMILRLPQDGHTLLLHGLAYAVNPSIFGTSSPYAIEDYVAVSMVGKGPLIFVAHPTLGPKSVRELIALAKDKPDALSYASGGTGTSPHLAAELFKSTSNTKMMHIPYKGTGAFMPDLLAGRVPLAFVSPLVVKPYVQSGQLLALGVTSDKRSKGWDAPTISEAGLTSYAFDAWYTILTPAKTPSEVVSRLNKVIEETLTAADVQEKWASLGVELMPGTSKEATSYVSSEYHKWVKVVKDANIKPE
jgi:tripartite-type tricarboxylate transporter receptor subunit TctC